MFVGEQSLSGSVGPNVDCCCVSEELPGEADAGVSVWAAPRLRFVGAPTGLLGAAFLATLGLVCQLYQLRPLWSHTPTWLHQA